MKFMPMNTGRMEEYIDSDRKMATAIGAKDIRTTMIQNRCTRAHNVRNLQNLRTVQNFSRNLSTTSKPDDPLSQVRAEQIARAGRDGERLARGERDACMIHNDYASLLF